MDRVWVELLALESYLPVVSIITSYFLRSFYGPSKEVLGLSPSEQKLCLLLGEVDLWAVYGAVAESAAAQTA